MISQPQETRAAEEKRTIEFELSKLYNSVASALLPRRHELMLNMVISPSSVTETLDLFSVSHRVTFEQPFKTTLHSTTTMTLVAVTVDLT